MARILDFADSFTSNVLPTSIAIAASAVTNTPAGNIVSVTVQAALNEVQTHIDTLNSSAVAAPTALAIARRDSSANIAVNNLNEAFSSIATAAATTTFTVASNPLVQFTGTTTQTAVMPDCTTLLTGCQFQVFNRSTGIVTVNASGGTLLQTMAAGSQCVFTCASVATAAGSWDLSYTPAGSSTVTLAAIQTLTGKTIGDALTLVEIATPSTPSAGQLKVYGKADNNLYTLNPSGTETQVGSGSGGSKNYLGTVNGVNGNGNFELGVAGGWALGTVGTLTNALPTGTPTFGSGAAGTASFSVTASGQLAGNYSGQLAFSAATVVGNMLSSPVFTIDKEDQAKVLSFKFYYSPTVGAALANWSGTSSNSFAVAVYDVANSVWIGQSANFGMTQSSGVGVCTGSFQTNATTASIRFVVYCANATTGACTLLVDDVTVGPQVTAIGAAITDYKAFTPVSTWTTNTTSTGFYTRIGDSARIVYNFALTGAPTGGAFSISLPAGLVADYTKLPAVTVSGPDVGTWTAARTGTAYYSGCATPVTGNIQQFNLTISGTGNTVTATSPATWASGDAVSVEITVPIVGWSSNVQMSSDTDTRVVAARISTNNTSQVFNSTAPLLIYSTVESDTHGAYNATTGVYTVPVAGWYQVDAQAFMSGTVVASGNSLSITLFKNGVGIAAIAQMRSAAAQGNPQMSGSTKVLLNAGDAITFRGYSDAATTPYGSSASYNNISISRLSGPAVIAQSESVCASYGLTTAQSVAINTVIKYDTKIKDSHNFFNVTTGLATIPISGTYAISASNHPSVNAGWYAVINGSAKAYISSAAGGLIGGGTVSYQLNSGDTVGVYSDNAATYAAPIAQGFLNIISVTKIGN